MEPANNHSLSCVSNDLLRLVSSYFELNNLIFQNLNRQIAIMTGLTGEIYYSIKVPAYLRRIVTQFPKRVTSFTYLSVNSFVFKVKWNILPIIK